MIMGSGSVLEQFVEVVDEVAVDGCADEHARSHAEKEVGHVGSTLIEQGNESLCPAVFVLWLSTRT